MSPPPDKSNDTDKKRKNQHIFSLGYNILKLMNDAVRPLLVLFAIFGGYLMKKFIPQLKNRSYIELSALAIIISLMVVTLLTYIDHYIK